MIIGIGTDIIEINRIESIVKKNGKFLEKNFTSKELEFFSKKKIPYESIAGNFAAKEAVSKAFGTGIRGFSLKDIEVLRDELGKPLINLSSKVKSILGLDNIIVHISISHDRSKAIAFVVIENT